MRKLTLFLILVAWLQAPLSDSAEGCAVAPPPGQRAQIQGEDVLIVWDPVHHLEHFIRRAAFDSEAQDLGFLVPTPTKPELAEAKGSVFGRLVEQIQPRPVAYKLALACVEFFPLKTQEGKATAAAPVTVIQETKVAGYDAVVLAATNAKALKHWLNSHGYATTPALEGWLKIYLDQGWMITAFKVPRHEGRTVLGSVRMSFATERPFFPYREPKSEDSGGKRSLRIFFVGPQRVEGGLGGKAWPAEVLYADELTTLGPILQGSVPTLGPSQGWLTAFYDPTLQRPSEDLYFSPSDQGPFQPPREITAATRNLYLDLVFLPFLVAWLYRRRARR